MLSVPKIILLTVFAFFAQIDFSSFDLTISSPLFVGFFTGVVVGNVPLGIAIGGTLQLMSLGLFTFGGTAVPDYLSGAIIGTALTATSANIAGLSLDESVALGLSLAIPVGLLLVQADILRRTINIAWHRRAVKGAEERKYNKVIQAIYLGGTTLGLSRALPVLVALVFGEPVVKLVIEYMPTWLMNGLKTAGGILPAMGMAILMRYLPFKKYYPFFIIGFILFACAGSMFNMVAIALLGFAAAVVFVMLKRNENSGEAALAGQETTVEVEIDE